MLLQPGALAALGLPCLVVADCGPAAGFVTPAQQAAAAGAVAARVASGDESVCGVVLHSFLLQGSQSLMPGKALTRGLSVAEPCMDWGATEAAIEKLAEAVRTARKDGATPAPKKARAA
jgi:3-deoxy-7-phosphoheptulonate synthase